MLNEPALLERLARLERTVTTLAQALEYLLSCRRFAVEGEARYEAESYLEGVQERNR
jgi:hypothetical protein